MQRDYARSIMTGQKEAQVIQASFLVSPVSLLQAQQWNFLLEKMNGQKSTVFLRGATNIGRSFSYVSRKLPVRGAPVRDPYINLNARGPYGSPPYGTRTLTIMHGTHTGGSCTGPVH